MPTTVSDAVLREMVERIVRGFDPERIILFGSQARGDAHAHSDVDLLVVMPDGTDRRAAMRAMLSELCGVGTPKDVVVMTTEDVERYGTLVGTVLRPALLEGRTLYERRGAVNTPMVAVR